MNPFDKFPTLLFQMSLMQLHLIPIHMAQVLTSAVLMWCSSNTHITYVYEHTFDFSSSNDFTLTWRCAFSWVSIVTSALALFNSSLTLDKLCTTTACCCSNVARAFPSVVRSSRSCLRSNLSCWICPASICPSIKTMLGSFRDICSLSICICWESVWPPPPSVWSLSNSKQTRKLIGLTIK